MIRQVDNSPQPRILQMAREQDPGMQGKAL